MKQCRSCLTRADAIADICPVCGIDQDKARHDLTDREKHVRRCARNIRIVAMLHLIFAGIGFSSLYKFPNHWGAAVTLSILNLILAVGLIRYDLRAYRLAVVFYFGIGIVNIISVNLLALPVILLLLYVVGNKTAKAIFERRLPEEN